MYCHSLTRHHQDDAVGDCSFVVRWPPRPGLARPCRRYAAFPRTTATVRPGHRVRPRPQTRSKRWLENWRAPPVVPSNHRNNTATTTACRAAASDRVAVVHCCCIRARVAAVEWVRGRLLRWGLSAQRPPVSDHGSPERAQPTRSAVVESSLTNNKPLYLSFTMLY